MIRRIRLWLQNLIAFPDPSFGNTPNTGAARISGIAKGTSNGK